jgi:DNA invertase Pin-like site-specific DNA recombinase
MGRARRQDRKIAVAYLRASTDEQSLSPLAQREAIEAWAAREGVHVAAYHADLGVSGATLPEHRPALLDALAALRAHRGGVLVVAKRDRLARDVGVAALVERAVYACGAEVATADGTSTVRGVEGMMLRGMADLFAAVEREMIRTRTKAALAAKKARGECVGEVAYGYRLAEDGVHVEPDPAEQATIVAARDMYASGLSIRAVAAELDHLGHRGRTGRALSHTQVHRIVRVAA